MKHHLDYQKYVLLIISAILGSLIFLLACDSILTEPDIPVDGDLPELPLTERHFEVGIAGIVPRNYPTSTQEDYQLFADSAHVVADYVGVYAGWDSPGLMEGFEFVKLHVKNVKPVVGIGFDYNKVVGNYFETRKDSFKTTVIEAIEKYSPDYLAIGGEVNRLIVEKSEEIFDQFVETYQYIYDAVKKKNPAIKVFTTFQLEFMKGAASLSGRTFDSHWEAIDQFEGKLDFVGFTIYPFLEFPTVDQIPENYYQEINQYVAKPIIIAEAGWLSEKVLSVQGSEQEQVDFVLGLIEATKELNVEMLLYSFLYDPESVEPLFSSVALRTNDGKAKEVYKYWRALKALKKQ